MTIIGTILAGNVPEATDGIVISSRRGAIGMSDAARQWMDWVDSHADPTELEFGKRIARKHQVYSVEIMPGLMAGTVAEIRSEPMQATISFSPPPDSFWERFDAALLEDPVSVAALFANREPENFADVIDAAGGALPPTGMVESSCTCGAAFCRHAIAMHCTFAEKLDESPWLRLELLGRSRNALCNVVREHWGDTAIPEDHERSVRPVDTARPFYGGEFPKDAALANFPEFEVIERLGPPPFFPVEERNVKRTIEKLYHD